MLRSGTFFLEFQTLELGEFFVFILSFSHFRSFPDRTLKESSLAIALGYEVYFGR